MCVIVLMVQHAVARARNEYYLMNNTVGIASVIKNLSLQLFDNIQSGASATSDSQREGLGGLLKHQHYAGCINKIKHLTVPEQLKYGLF